MRQITNQAAAAFLKGEPFAKGNTCVHVVRHDTEVGRLAYTGMSLHGSIIAEARFCPASGKCIEVRGTLAGRPTVTPRDRLNGVCRAALELPFNESGWRVTKIVQRKKVQYLLGISCEACSGHFTENPPVKVGINEWFRIY